MDSQIPNPKVVDEYDIVQRPYVMYRVWVQGNNGGIVAAGVGFSKCELGDKWDEGFGRRLARKRALANAEKEFFTMTANASHLQRMREAEALVVARYPKPAPFPANPTHKYTYSSADFLKQWLPIHNFTDDDSAEIARDDDES